MMHNVIYSSVSQVNERHYLNYWKCSKNYCETSMTLQVHDT